MHIQELRSFRPVFLSNDLVCCQPLCHLVLGCGADFLFICKPQSYVRLQELLHDDFIQSTDWQRQWNHKTRLHEYRRLRWMSGLLIRDSDATVLGTWSSKPLRLTTPLARTTGSAPITTRCSLVSASLATTSRASLPSAPA